MNRKYKIKLINIIAITVVIAAAGISSVSAAQAPDNMALIPGGVYSLGAPESDYYASEESKPLHRITLDPYYMDKYEVTVGAYSACVAAEVCSEPTSVDSQTRKNYYSTAYHAFPVVNVTWQDADNYCRFVGKRLPTEAEWERAAMGLDGYRRYPWGDLPPRPYQANTTKVPGDTEIGNGYPAGNSPFKIANMIDNVAEWVADWYAPGFYSSGVSENPSGPSEGSEKVIRGGSFASDLVAEHLTNRYHADPTSSSPMLGFRCAMDAESEAGYAAFAKEGEEPVQAYGFVSSGQSEGIFIVRNPGADQTLECIAGNGSVLSIYEGPIDRDYTSWIRVSTKTGCKGWTLTSSVLRLE